jgi:hypothetical protein
MHISFLITLALPLLAALARPLPGGQPDSFDLELRTYPLDVDTLDLRSLSPREPEDLEVLLEARRAPVAVPVNKAAKQQDRKAKVRADVQKNQDRKAKGREIAKQQKATDPTVRIPKSPKPPAMPHAPKTAKHQKTQAAANQRQRERKQAGGAKFADAKKAYAATSHLPNRKKVYNVNERKPSALSYMPSFVNFHCQMSIRRFRLCNTPVLMLVALSSTATCTRTTPSISRYVSLHFLSLSTINVLSQPKVFGNRPQGPVGNKSKPIPYMNGKGQEFPLAKGHPGYKGERPGAARVIIQPTKTGMILGIYAI